MKIIRIEVIGLNGNDDVKMSFNEDINILTGRNGSGKTTLLKLMWYLISANIERAIREISFSRASIVTSVYRLQVEKTDVKGKKIVAIKIEDNKGCMIFDKKEPFSREAAVEEANQMTVKMFDTSIFFPTFRRIEGGFSMTGPSGLYARRYIRENGEEYLLREDHDYGSGIQEALESHAERLSVRKHKFVSSISTVDIQQLVSRRYNEATTQVDKYSKNLSENIFGEIRKYRNQHSTEKEALRDAVSTLDKINEDVVEFEKVREDSFKSLDILSEVISKIFTHKGIRLNKSITLGDLDQSINSDHLSAGEKQMLSFLCYNALYRDCPFFIDEPELSLHVDWQRTLLDVLMAQNTNNQMFIATHSPFIYTQFADKEIMIGSDRGNSDSE